MQDNSEKAGLKVSDRILIKMVGFTNVEELIQARRQFMDICYFSKADENSHKSATLTDLKNLLKFQLPDDTKYFEVRSCKDNVH